MRFEDVYKELAGKKYYVFSSEDLCAFFPTVKKTTIAQYLSRWKKNGLVASVRKNLFELTYPKSINVPDMYLANKIYAPSYVSLETALSHYSMIPDVSMAVTSITVKATRRFRNQQGLFTYQSVQPKAFCGYTIESQNGFDVLIAEPEKAMADYLYFKTLRKTPLDIEALRLDRKKMARLNRRELDGYSDVYGIDVRGLLHGYL